MPKHSGSDGFQTGLPGICDECFQEQKPSERYYSEHNQRLAVLVLLSDPYSLDFGRASFFHRVSVCTHDSVTGITNSSFIQMQYDLFNGQRHASSAPLTVADDGIVPLSDDVAVPADSLGSSRRLLFQNRAELERLVVPDNRSLIHHP